MGGWCYRVPDRNSEATIPSPAQYLQLVPGTLAPRDPAGVQSAYSFSRRKERVLCEMWQYAP